MTGAEDGRSSPPVTQAVDGRGPSRVVAVANVLGAAGAVASAVLVLVTGLSVVLAASSSRSAYERFTVPPAVAFAMFSLGLPWVVLARRGGRIPSLSLTRWAALVPMLVAGMLIALAGVAEGALGLLAAGVFALLALPARYLFDRFLGAPLDDAAFAASCGRAESDVAEARLAVASLALGAMPLMFLPFAGPTGRAQGAGLWVAAALCVVPALVALAGSRFRVRFTPPIDARDTEHRLWAVRRALGADLRAPFRWVPRSPGGSAWASALLVGTAAWRAPVDLYPWSCGLFVGEPGLGNREWVLGLVFHHTVWLLVSTFFGCVAFVCATHPLARRRSRILLWLGLAATTGASMLVLGFAAWGARVALVCLGLALVPAWVARTTTDEGSLDSVDAERLATGVATGAISGAAFLAWCCLGARVAALGAFGAGALAAFVAARAWVRLDARRLVGALALRGRTDGVRATGRGDFVVVSFDHEAPGYREGGVEEHVVLALRSEDAR